FLFVTAIGRVRLVHTATAELATYRICWAGCSAVVMACYTAASSTCSATFGASASATIIGCNTAFGTCQAACAAFLLRENTALSRYK
ncbi:hypothetical protein C7974DRAFT_323177, partial [Boeremia exigua]|uniref:uncharacterized protein n=1 Tax=Boeremia exigua TaxID=749465 RepID=UPI001E8D74DE